MPRKRRHERAGKKEFSWADKSGAMLACSCCGSYSVGLVVCGAASLEKVWKKKKQSE